MPGATGVVGCVLVLLGLVACGRVAFDKRGDGGDTAFDAVADAQCRPGGASIPISDVFDDGEIVAAFPSGMRWFPVGETTDMGRAFVGWWDAAPVWAYFRFGIPTYSTPIRIDTATLTLVGDGPGGTAGAVWNPGMGWALEIAVEASSLVEPIGNENQYPGGLEPRVLATPRIRWPASGGLSWSQTAANISPDIASLLEAALAVPPVMAGPRYIQLWVRGVDIPTAADTEIAWTEFSRNAANAARLDYAYSCP